MKRIGLLLISMFFLTAGIMAGDVYVTVSGAGSNSGADWANAKSDLGEVLYNATSGTTVHVGAGTYFPTRDYQGNSSASNVEKRFKFMGGVTILGGYPADGGTERNHETNVTVLNGKISETETVYTLSYGLLGSSDIVIDGFQFRNATGRMSGSDDDYLGDFSGGAGALIVMGGTPVPGATTPEGTGIKLINCDIDGFSAKWGGAIKLQRPDQANNPMLTLENCSFTNNITGQNGGAILAYGWDMEVSDCYFDGNDASSSGSGGAIASFNQTVFNAKNTTFKNGKARSNGAGVLLYCEGSDEPTTATFINCDFIENDGWDGVGMYANKVSNAKVSGCTFEKNTGGGAGVIRLNGTFDIDNCIFNENDINISPGGWLDGSAATISNCIYTNNRSAAGQNGVIFKVQIGQIDVSNCYATGNSGKSIAGIAWGAKGTMKNVSIIDNVGAAIAFQGATYTVINSTISGNTSPTNGGVIDGSWEGSSAISVYDCTIAGNSSADGQSAMYISGGTASIDFDNCIYVENGDEDTEYSELFGSFTRSYCIWDDVRYGDGRFFALDNPFTIGTYLSPVGKVNNQYVHLLADVDDNPAVANGSPNSAGLLDQLGNVRSENPSIGAVEFITETSINTAKETKLVLYPSITTGQVVIVNPFMDATMLSVYSLDGRLVKQVKMTAGDNLLNFSGLSNGTYITQLKRGDKIMTSRFIKK